MSEQHVSETTPDSYARLLLRSLGRSVPAAFAADDRTASLLWALSGAMSLTGQADGAPLACAAPLAACAQGAWRALAMLCPQRFAVDFPAYCLLGERAAIAGYQRCGRVSAGGACRLLDTADGCIALNLARDDDWQLVPAWLEQPAADWEAIAEILSRRDRASLVQRARLLGLAMASEEAPRQRRHWYESSRLAASAAPRIRREAPLVIDLCALWAGPLAGQLLLQAGARVIKVESVTRLDGARSGPPAFYDLMNAGKESVVVDFRSDDDRARLQALLLKADIVLESARPRGLEQLGIRAADIVASRPGMSWVSITGYGRQPPMRDWIAYGDDAGVAAGLGWLLHRDSAQRVFCADAVADPLAGLHAALLAWASWLEGGGRLLDISLQGVAAYGASLQHAAHGAAGAVAQPAQARPVTAHAAAPGVDSARVLREFC